MKGKPMEPGPKQTWGENNKNLGRAGAQRRESQVQTLEESSRTATRRSARTKVCDKRGGLSVTEVLASKGCGEDRSTETGKTVDVDEWSAPAACSQSGKMGRGERHLGQLAYSKRWFDPDR